MKPKPFSLLNHLTVPWVMLISMQSGRDAHRVRPGSCQLPGSNRRYDKLANNRREK
jgi:hypothetical protein